MAFRCVAGFSGCFHRAGLQAVLMMLGGKGVARWARVILVRQARRSGDELCSCAVLCAPGWVGVVRLATRAAQDDTPTTAVWAFLCAVS